MTPPSLDQRVTEKAVVPDADAALPSGVGRAGNIVDAARSGHSDLATDWRLFEEAVAQDAHRAADYSHR